MELFRAQIMVEFISPKMVFGRKDSHGVSLLAWGPPGSRQPGVLKTNVQRCS